jgi:hypothetical protein
LEGHSDPIGRSPLDNALTTKRLALDHKGEAVGNAQRARNFDTRAGRGNVPNCAGDAAQLVEVNLRRFQDFLSVNVSALVHGTTTNIMPAGRLPSEINKSLRRDYFFSLNSIFDSSKIVCVAEKKN